LISCDTNILLYAYNRDAPEYEAAITFLRGHLKNQDFALSELVLVELYNLLRNPAVLGKSLSAKGATDVIAELRSNSYWTVLPGNPDIWDSVWTVAAQPNFPRRAIFDARLAYSLAADGVTQFATRNIKDFARFNTFEVFDPIANTP